MENGISIPLCTSSVQDCCGEINIEVPKTSVRNDDNRMLPSNVASNFHFDSTSREKTHNS